MTKKTAHQILLEIKDYKEEIKKYNIPSHTKSRQDSGVMTNKSYVDFVKLKINEYFNIDNITID